MVKTKHKGGNREINTQRTKEIQREKRMGRDRDVKKYKETQIGGGEKSEEHRARENQRKGERDRK